MKELDDLFNNIKIQLNILSVLVFIEVSAIIFCLLQLNIEKSKYKN